ncbi:MAG: hypothetical protein R3F54_08755 [Alphaproteobacteria bacterium]
MLVDVEVEPSFANVDGSEIYSRMSEDARIREYDEGHTIFPGDAIEERVRITIAGPSSEVRRRRPVLMCCVRYKNPLDDTIHQTSTAISKDRVEPIASGMEMALEESRIKLTILPAGGLVIN